MPLLTSDDLSDGGVPLIELREEPAQQK